MGTSLMFARRYLGWVEIAACVILFEAVLSGSANAATQVDRKAGSCSYEDVSSAVNTAESGDTVIVPAGSATWNKCLTITKGITLQGAGIGQTVIISSIAEREGSLIRYAPASPSLNEPFRITGFTLDANNISHGIILANYTTIIINKIRVDHNRILKAGSRRPGEGKWRCIAVYGTVYGVIDNNVIDSTNGKAIDSGGMEGKSWAELTRNFGDENNIYYEDNTFISNDTFSSCGNGGRYVSRYNNYFGSQSNFFPILDAHGNQLKGIYGTMMVEIYGNNIDLGPQAGCFLDHRGGQALVFFNKIKAGRPVTSKVRDEYDDATHPAPNPFLQHVTNSYYWNNRSNSLLISPYIVKHIPNKDVNYDGVQLAEDVDFWVHKVDFGGTKGMGCGSLENRPGTCVPGTAYWATEQPCAEVSDDNIGAHPRKPISGTLYKCTAPNVWSTYYTPYTYPHPLRGEKSVLSK